MGNIISLNSETPVEEYIAMSNGLTDVFINVLVLSGSKLAGTDDEKRLIVYLAEKDQSITGIGTVGFEICEMPWNTQTFDECKSFLLKVIETAKSRMGWEKLEYEPNEELLLPCLQQFAVLVSKMTADDISTEAVQEWLQASAEDLDDPVVCGFPVCEKHNTLLSTFGCQICNN